MTTHDLKSAGLKATLPRLRIISLFEHSKVRHLTAEDVYRMLVAEDLDIGLATVYRVLTQFEQAGLLVRHHFESGKAVFELNEGTHHDHLVCMQCGRVEEFYDAEIEKRQEKIAKLIREQMDWLARYESVDGGWGYYDFRVGSQRPATDSTPFTSGAILVGLHEAKQIGIDPPVQQAHPTQRQAHVLSGGSR